MLSAVSSSCSLATLLSSSVLPVPSSLLCAPLPPQPAFLCLPHPSRPPWLRPAWITPLRPTPRSDRFGRRCQLGRRRRQQQPQRRRRRAGHFQRIIAQRWAHGTEETNTAMSTRVKAACVPSLSFRLTPGVRFRWQQRPSFSETAAAAPHGKAG